MMPSRHLPLDLLRAFVAIADSSSFSQAAAALGRTQSTVSLQIKRLEELVGRSLLVRKQGRVSGPTDEGRVLLDYAREMLRLNDEAYRCLATPVAVGTLRVGLPEYLLETVFPEALQQFRTIYPHLNVSACSDLSTHMLADLDAGKLDVAVFTVMDDEDRADAAILSHEPLAWMASDKLNGSLPTPLPLAVFGDGCRYRATATAALTKAGVQWHIAYTAASYAGLRDAVTSGLGIAALPLSLQRSGMTIVEANLPPLPDARIAVKFATGHSHPAARRLVELLGQQMRVTSGSFVSQ